MELRERSISISTVKRHLQAADLKGGQQENHYYGRLIKGKSLTGLENTMIRPVISGKRYSLLTNQNLKYSVLSGVSLFVMLCKLSACIQPTIKRESFIMIWGSFGGGAVGDLVKYRIS